MAIRKWKMSDENGSTEKEEVSTDIDFAESFDLAMFDALANEPAKPARRRRVEPVVEETNEEEDLSSRLTRRSRSIADRPSPETTSVRSWESLKASPREATSSTYSRSTTTSPLSGTTFSLSSLNKSQETEPVRNTIPQTTTSLFSNTERACQSPKEIHPFRLFCRTVLFICITILAGWAIYGVSVQSNLGFWRETFQNEISYIARSLPIMMIDHP